VPDVSSIRQVEDDVLTSKSDIFVCVEYDKARLTRLTLFHFSDERRTFRVIPFAIEIDFIDSSRVNPRPPAMAAFSCGLWKTYFPKSAGHPVEHLGGSCVRSITLNNRFKCQRNFGAGEGNRTLVFSLEGCCSTIELHPRWR
jgi:hypothetical protein